MAELTGVPPIKPSPEEQLRSAFADRESRTIQRERERWFRELQRLEPADWLVALTVELGQFAKYVDLCTESPTARWYVSRSALELQGILSAVYALTSEEAVT